MKFAEQWAAQRRVWLLRLLVDAGGEANRELVLSAVASSYFSINGSEAIEADLAALLTAGCISSRLSPHGAEIIFLTDLGDDAARGRADVAGVATSSWEPRP